MPRLTGETIPTAIIKAPDIMDGLHTFEQVAGTLYQCRHCSMRRTMFFIETVTAKGENDVAV